MDSGYSESGALWSAVHSGARYGVCYFQLGYIYNCILIIVTMTMCMYRSGRAAVNELSSANAGDM